MRKVKSLLGDYQTQGAQEGVSFQIRKVKDFHCQHGSIKADFILTISFGFISLGPSGNVCFQLEAIRGWLSGISQR
jgi:hypothetical protein